MSHQPLSTEYAVRVIATSQVIGVVSVTAESEGQALAKAGERINQKLKEQGYEFQLQILEAEDRARLAAA